MVISDEITYYPPQGNCLGFLHKSIREMFVLLDRYIDTWTVRGNWNDRPYHVNERATLSVLAGAIWRSSPENFVIEEICGEKAASDCSYRGRYDIWFLSEGRSCYGEAKQVWPIASTFTADRGNDYMTILHQEADAAALSMSPHDHHGLGILFSVPSINRRNISTAGNCFSQYRDRLADCTQAWARRESYHVLFGKYFREDLLHPDAFYESSNGNVLSCPGLDVVIATKPA